MNKGPPAFARQRSATTECLEGALAVENPILDFSATLAKPALVRVDDALRAQMAGALAVRARLDAELVEPAPVPVSRRQRKRSPSLTKALREAKKAGIPVTGATFTADSVSLSFGEAAKSNGNDLDHWLAGRHESPIKGH
jgi:hypothetical protein